MSDIPSFPYEILWGERTLRSVANLTRRDGEEFMALAPRCRCGPRSHEYALERANRRSTTCAAVGFAVRRCCRVATVERRGRLMADVTVKRLEDFESDLRRAASAGFAPASA